MKKDNLIITLPSGLSFDMIYIEGGTFFMGDNESESNREKPVHQVKVPSFYMSKYQVTQALWTAVIEDNPSTFKGALRPVERVSWLKVKDFIQKLNQRTAQQFRLPTEAEWEYAARGGQYSQRYIYAGSDKLSQVGWYSKNSNRQTHEVGQKLANELGLYDMSGNVWEWCEDDFHDNYKGAPEDGSAWVNAPDRGDYRVLRGGSWAFNPVSCRSVYRSRNTPDGRDGNIGCRLVLSLQSVG